MIMDYGTRALKAIRLSFRAPSEVSDLIVVERLTGTATTDFGAPDRALSRDTKPIDAAELERFQMVLKACWRAFDTAVREATGKSLRKGPRGGGRDLASCLDSLCDTSPKRTVELRRNHQTELAYRA